MSRNHTDYTRLRAIDRPRVCRQRSDRLKSENKGAWLERECARMRREWQGKVQGRRKTWTNS